MSSANRYFFLALVLLILSVTPCSGFAVLPSQAPKSASITHTAATFYPVVLFSSPAVAEPTTETPDVVKDEEELNEAKEGEKMGGEAWEVRLFNDPFNKREFVARCLSVICGKSDNDSFQIMMEAHKNGMGVIGRYAFEVAEMYSTSLKGEGLLVDMIQVDDE